MLCVVRYRRYTKSRFSAGETLACLHPLRASIHRFVPLTDAEWAPPAAEPTPRRLTRKQYFVRQGEAVPDVASLLAGACAASFVCGPTEKSKRLISSSRIT